MTLEIIHTFSFIYSEPVRLNPHYFYLSPSLSPFQKLIEHSIDVDPKPDLLIKNLDQENNIQHICYLNSVLKNFTITAKCKVDSENFNTFDFVFFPYESAKLPFKYPARLSVYIGQALRLKRISPIIKAYGLVFAEKVNFDTIAFLTELSKHIQKDFAYEIRLDGDPNAATYTLEHKRGSCRDFVVFMIDMCASMGLLARFVSGYFIHGRSNVYDLHAWVEVLLPGGGWRGFDPTEGNVIDNRYLALAKSLEPKGLIPLRGTFRAVENTIPTYTSQITVL
jgi:Transglutaminase-like superfamily/Bacterial transglutaminase-like N-terminal region